MNKVKKAENLMEEGWKSRENLEFDKAEKLLNEAKRIFEEEKEWFNLTEALNHLAYTKKLRAVHSNMEGLKIAKQAKKVADEKSLNKALVYRALMSLANSAGLYEQALKWGNESLKLFERPAVRADILSHIATFLLRTGNLKEAQETIERAEKLMKKGFNEEREPHRSIWKSKIYLTKGLILYNKGKARKSKKFLKKAEDIAIDKNLKTRLKEIQAVKELFE